MNVNLTSTATPNGSSSDNMAFVCERRAWLDHQARSRRPADYIQPLEAEEVDAKGRAKPVATLVGTAVGNLVQRFYGGEIFSAEEVEFSWYGTDIAHSHPASCAEARRLYSAYEMRYGREHMGKVIGVEVPVSAEIAGVVKTGALDIGIELATEDDVRKFEDSRNVLLNGPGFYSLDVKTEGRNSGDDKYMDGDAAHQFFLYYAILLKDPEILRRFGECRGSIADVITKTNEIQMRTIFIPPLTEDQTKRVEYKVRKAEAVKAMTVLPDPRPIESACNAWGRPCYYLTQGICPRY